jgi:hypothetical protein
MNIAQLNIELSSRCDRNTLCGFCGHQDRKTNPNLKLGDMDFAMLQSIAEQVPADTIISFHRDGDPLVYPRLREALQLFRHHPTSIVTHGEVLGRRAAEIIDNCTTVTVSVIPNDKDRTLQLESVRAFLAAKGDRPPQLQLKAVGNVDDISAYESLGVPIIGRSLHNKRVNQNYQSAPSIPEIRVCLDFLSRPTVDWQGRMFCCNRLDTSDAGLIGDLRQDTLRNVWNGPRRRAMLEAHLAGRRDLANALCASCTFWGIPSET